MRRIPGALVVLLLIALPAWPEPVRSTGRTATLEGEVVDEQGRLLEGAEVRLLPPYASLKDEAAVLVYLEDPRLPLTTDAEGRFRFERLTAGLRFDLLVFHPRHPSAYLSGVEVPLQEPLRILLETGRTLDGRVVDEAGRPIPRASIQEIASTPRLRELVGTDARGHFHFQMLRPGPLVLAANADGFLPKEVQLDIPEKGEPSSIEIVLGRGITIEGRVLDEQGGPVAGATVEVHAPHGLGRHVTDRAGRYRIAALPQGTYRMTVYAVSADMDRMLERGLEIGDDDISGLDLTLTSGFELSGRVTDLEGAPAARVRISLYSSILGLMRHAQTGDDGFFRLPGVPEARYFLTASAAESDETTTQEVEVAGGPITGLELRLAPPEKP